MNWSCGAGLVPSVALLLGCATAGPEARPAPAARAPAACSSVAPPALAAPAGHRLSFELRAQGVQVYACAGGAAGPAWIFQAPEATLSELDGRAAGRHFAGPTWEASDGSRVVGAKAAAATPEPTAIPWLLLRADSHAGTGRMEPVAFVQRVATSGGLAPSTGCDAASIGAIARVPYQASYCFLSRTRGE